MNIIWCHCSITVIVWLIVIPWNVACHYLSEVAQTHVHWFSDAIQPPHHSVAPISYLRRFKKLRRLKLYQAAFQPLCYETWNQLQEKMAKKYRNVEYKQYNTKQTMNHWRNKRES